MMTTVAALFGTLPIALGYGEGADARQPLGLAVVGGLVVSQFLTLYITPVIYLYLDAVQERLRGSKKTAVTPGESLRRARGRPREPGPSDNLHLGSPRSNGEYSNFKERREGCEELPILL